MSDTLYEYSNTGDDTYATVYGADNFEAMTFTPSTTHTITSIKLLAYRIGSPGTLTASIRATSSSLPTGADLASGTLNADAITDVTTGLWYEITLGAGTKLLSGTEYAMVIRALTGDTNNRFAWRGTLPGTYASGNTSYSQDTGSSWTDYANNYDWQFEEYGIPIAGEGQGLIAVVGETLHYVSKNGVEYVIQGTAV